MCWLHCGSCLCPVQHVSGLYSVLPQEWKVHQITPIFKSGDPHCVENYRPISLLCILSKVLESIVYSKIIDFVQDTLCQHQFGFLRNRSSVSQLLITFSNIISNCESGLPTDQVFFDFRKAFDCLPLHPPLQALVYWHHRAIMVLVQKLLV